jgi:two-component system NarL family sensor kinase
MSLRNFIRSPLSLCVAFGVFAAACLSRRSPAKPAASKQPACTNEHESPRTQEITLLARRLLISTEEDKARIARELHDGLGSTLTAVNLDLYWVQQRLADQPALANRLGRAIDVLASTVEIKRRIIHALRPAALDNLGLSLAIESNIAEFEKTSTVPVEMDLPAESPALSTQASIALFRIYQEALADAAEHPEISMIAVSLHDDGEGVSLKITDDGLRSGGGTRTADYLTMRERAAAVEGTLSVSHGPDGRGTTVRAFLPHPIPEPSKPALGEL